MNSPGFIPQKSSMRRLLILATSLSIAALVLCAGAWFFVKPLCLALGGNWASTSDTCITRACYATGSCGIKANPAAYCHRLKIGDTRAEAYFQLGMPSHSTTDSAWWPQGKASNGTITATFKNEQIVSLDCPQQ